MRAISIAVVTFVVVFVMGGVADARQTCSSIHNVCVRASKARVIHGSGTGLCDAAYSECLKTGVWDTTMYGSYGIRRTGVIRR